MAPRAERLLQVRLERVLHCLARGSHRDPRVADLQQHAQVAGGFVDGHEEFPLQVRAPVEPVPLPVHPLGLLEPVPGGEVGDELDHRGPVGIGDRRPGRAAEDRAHVRRERPLPHEGFPAAAAAAQPEGTQRDARARRQKTHPEKVHKFRLPPARPLTKGCADPSI